MKTFIPLYYSNLSSGAKVDSAGSEIDGGSSNHEALIRSLLSKPFKVPMKNFGPGGGHGRSLGMRKSASKLCLYDPYEEGALVLYHPPEGIPPILFDIRLLSYSLKIFYARYFSTFLS